MHLNNEITKAKVPSTAIKALCSLFPKQSAHTLSSPWSTLSLHPSQLRTEEFPLCHQLLGSKTHLPTEPTWSKAMCSPKNDVSHTPLPRQDGDKDSTDEYGIQKGSLKGQSRLEEMLMCSPAAAVGMDSSPVPLTGAAAATLSLPLTSRPSQRRRVKHYLAQGTTVQIFCYMGLNLTLLYKHKLSLYLIRFHSSEAKHSALK